MLGDGRTIVSEPVLPPFAAIRAFDAIGRLGGIRKAAGALGVNHAIVSRHLISLEQRFCTLLFDRKTGRLTKAGAEYHARITRALAEIAQAGEAASVANQTKLTIFCASGLALHWLTGRLGRFRFRVGEMMIDLRSSDDEPNLLEGEAAGDIRYIVDERKLLRRPEIRTLELGRPSVFPVAAPAVVDKITSGVSSATDLLHLPLIEEQGAEGWKLWFAAQGLHDATLSPVARYGSAQLALAAARAGQGIALGNQFLVSDDLREGRLLPVIATAAKFMPISFGAYLFLASRLRWNEPALANFRNWLKAEFARDT